MELLEPLPNGKFRVLDTNKLLMKHNQELDSLRKENKALKKTVADFEKRIGFAEQVAREAVTIKESETFQKMLKESKKALEDAYKTQKFCLYLLEKIGYKELLPSVPINGKDH